MKVLEKIFESFTWIDIEHPNKPDLEKIAKEYNLNHHLIKDSLERGHLPKYEKYNNIDFYIFRAYTSDINLQIDEVEDVTNKIAFFKIQDKLITIHRSHFKFLNTEEVENTTMQELFLKIISSMVETYKKPTIDIGLKISDIEKTIFLKDHRNILLEELYYIKSKSRILRKVLHITQAVVDQIPNKDDHSSLYQDIRDQLLQHATVIDESVENANQLMTTYLSISEQKNNEVVRLLTIFSAFFLPLTFIVGVYGMNFDFMPELKWRLGYPFAITLMLVIVLVIFIWFRRRKII
jgi:magnesium transporter